MFTVSNWIVGFAVAILIGLAVWNVYHSDKDPIKGTSVTLIVAAFAGILLMTGKVQSVDMGGVKVAIEKAEKAEQKAESAQRASQEAAAISLINQFRYAKDEEMEKGYLKGIDLLKELYGNDYKSRISRLIQDKYIALPEEYVSKHEVFSKEKPSNLPPFIDQINKNKPISE